MVNHARCTVPLQGSQWIFLAASLEGYRKIAGGAHRATLLETEQAWLAAVKPDLVVSDIVPLACAAAAAVGIPCVCISNFSWGGRHNLNASQLGTFMKCLEAKDWASNGYLSHLLDYTVSGV